MKLLRETIRRFLLESNERYYEKIAKLLNGSIEDIRQAFELAEAIGLIQVIQSSDDQYEIGQSSGGYHTFRFRYLEEDFGAYLKNYHDTHQPYKTPFENAYWGFPRGLSELEIVVVTK